MSKDVLGYSSHDWRKYTDDNGFWTIYKTKSGMTVMKKEKKNNDN